MKVIIEGAAYVKGLHEPDHQALELPIEIIGPDNEDVPSGCVRLVHPEVTLEIGVEDLARALRPFLKNYEF